MIVANWQRVISSNNKKQLLFAVIYLGTTWKVKLSVSWNQGQSVVGVTLDEFLKLLPWYMIDRRQSSRVNPTNPKRSVGLNWGWWCVRCGVVEGVCNWTQPQPSLAKCAILRIWIIYPYLQIGKYWNNAYHPSQQTDLKKLFFFQYFTVLKIAVFSVNHPARIFFHTTWHYNYTYL